MKNIKVEKGMLKEDINKLIGEYVLLKDSIFGGASKKHNWECRCGNVMKDKLWRNMIRYKTIKCETCIYKEVESRYRKEVEKSNYKYIRSFRSGDILPNGSVIKDSPSIEIICGYCNNRYITSASGFINMGKRCSNCCGSYEKSFEYHVENVLNKKIKDVWDYDRNAVNPKHIVKYYTKTKVWIKCDSKKYHPSHQVLLSNYSKRGGCKYCASKEVHPLDSFGYHNFDKVISWHPDNEISPFRVAPMDNRKYKFICFKCKETFLKSPNVLNNTTGFCNKCSMSKGEKEISNILIARRTNYIYNEPYFKDLLSESGNPLRPDFILPEKKIWIEYDGEFHYKKYYEDQNYEILKYHDKLKDKYAKKHGWKLIRIPYWEFDNIENILEKEIS